MHKNIVDMTGKRFGNLTVLELTDLKTEKKRNTVWKCQCDCGNITYKTGSDLRDKRRLTWSCGCQTKRKRPVTQYVKKDCRKHDDKVREEFANKLKSYLDGRCNGLSIQEMIDDVLNTYN